MPKQLAVVYIKDPEVETRTVGANTFHSQRGLLRTSEDESMAIEIPLRRGAAGYPAGAYYLGGASFDRDQYKRLCIAKSGLDLIPVPAQGAPAPKG